jgi:hypothetical protein
MHIWLLTGGGANAGAALRQNAADTLTAVYENVITQNSSFYNKTRISDDALLGPCPQITSEKKLPIFGLWH